MQWAVPLLMAGFGAAWTVADRFRHPGERGWPGSVIFGLVVMGGVGPLLSWISLRWAARTAEAYFASQAELAQRNAELAALNTLALASSQSLDLQVTLSTALSRMIEALDASAGMVFLQGNGGPGLQLEAHRGISIEMAQQEAQLAPGHCLCGQAVQTRQVLFAGHLGGDARCTSNLCICEGFRSVACAPLEVKGKLVGLLQLASPNEGHFVESQRDFVAAMARQVSTSVENARLYAALRSFNLDLEQRVGQRTQEVELARSDLAQKASQLQRLLNESQRVQEDTQARIAQDMHDSVTQLVVGALYETQAARQALRADPDRAAACLAHSQQLLADAEIEIRRVIYDLRPPVLDALGLAEALRQFARAFAATFRIECPLQVIGRARRLPRETEISVYRIVQAALHNVASHAHAHQAHITCDFGAECLHVTIQDDGIGFDASALPALPGEHLGLIGMRERSVSLGADLRLSSQPGQGARIDLILPAPAYQD